MIAPTVRLHLYFAREAPRAVILRQGPSRQFRMILWHTDTDTFEDGQWLKKKVYAERCAIAPDGRHFLYFMLDAKWQSPSEGAYTVLCRPPWFTALSLFPEGNTWGGGGEFLDSRHYVATGGDDIIGRDDGLTRVYRRKPSAGNRTGLETRDGSRAPIGRDARRRLLEGGEHEPAVDRYLAEGGRLCRRDGDSPALIRDFTDMAFEEIIAPYDPGPDPVQVGRPRARGRK